MARPPQATPTGRHNKSTSAAALEAETAAETLEDTRPTTAAAPTHVQTLAVGKIRRKHPCSYLTIGTGRRQHEDTSIANATMDPWPFPLSLRRLPIAPVAPLSNETLQEREHL
jgi:hypothetical protein